MPSILLKHQPDLLGVAESNGVSLQLSGHTHKAQMFPLSLITKWIYHGFDYGLHRFGNMQIYTSSGVGTWGPPLRVGTKAEIVRITFG
jgi:predicted MPP superfamily phosphohydrolase